MESTIIAVYEKLEEARDTRDDLERAGFSRNDVRISEEEAGRTAEAGTEERPREGGIKGFFKDLFGMQESSRDVALYEGAVRHGNYLVSVLIADEAKSAIATDVLNRHHPIDIDERESQWLDTSATYATSATRPAATSGTTSSTERRSIPVVEEQLEVGKREVQRGGVRVYPRVTEQPVEKSVSLREERVSVERTPANRPASPQDIEAFKEGTFELREKTEVPVIEKTARVVEDVRIGKETRERTQKVSDTVKRTEVKVEQLGGESYRAHFDKNYAAGGVEYEDYAPAYEYGARLADDERWRGQDWNAAETYARSDWETRYPNSKWEQFKAAIRHGWDKATGKR